VFTIRRCGKERSPQVVIALRPATTYRALRFWQRSLAGKRYDVALPETAHLSEKLTVLPVQPGASAENSTYIRSLGILARILLALCPGGLFSSLGSSPFDGGRADVPERAAAAVGERLSAPPHWLAWSVSLRTRQERRWRWRWGATTSARCDGQVISGCTERVRSRAPSFLESTRVSQCLGNGRASVCGDASGWLTTRLRPRPVVAASAMRGVRG
jgi:hypothetical protein